MRHQLGTKKWVEHNNGKLGFRDRMSLIFQGLVARARTRKDLKRQRKVKNLSIDNILPPDSAICTEAMILCESLSQPYLFNHCMRSYFWARLLNEDQKFDDEATFVAIMLHDLGLTDAYRITEGPQQCFTLAAAQVAEKLATKHQWHDVRAKVVANAITLHLNIIIDAKHGREAQLVRMGSGADVAGLGLNLLHNNQIDEVTKQYPRLNFKQEISRDLSIEAKQRPCCRTAFLYNKLNFADYIRNAKFDE